MNSFLNNFSGKTLKISSLIDNRRLQKVKQNRELRKPLIDTTLLCGRLGISFRGHRDDSSYYPGAGEFSKNPGVGNFIEIINFAIRRGDKALHSHYENSKKNASYLSKTSQNDLIKACSNIIVDDITSRVKKAQYFSVLADEAMDMSGKEQISLTLRFVEDGGVISEEFLGFVHLVNGLCGKDIAEAITTKIFELSLDIKNCRGQGYDGQWMGSEMDVLPIS